MEIATERAKLLHAKIQCLFLTDDKADNDSYGFPSDINTMDPEDGASEARAENEEIIRDNINIAVNMCKLKNVECSTERQKNPDENSLDSYAHLSPLIIIEDYNAQSEYAVTSVDLKSCFEKYNDKTQWVKA
jgi:hypothetical protein